MARMSAYDCYALYVALKNHFTQDAYDYFKYGGKINLSKNSFLMRKDKYQFQKLSRVCDEKEIKDYIIANFIKDNRWVGNLLDEEAKTIYHEYQKRKQSLSYLFNNELNKNFSTTIFKSKSNDYPEIIHLYLQGEVSPETFALLDHFIQFSRKYDEKYGKDDVIWSKIRLLSKKYLPFIEYDKDKIKEIIKNKMADITK